MQSETPGARDSSRHDDLPRIACAQNERIGISPTYKTFGAMCLIQCSTHFTSLNSSWSMRLLASQVLPSDLAKPCSGRPPCLLGSDSLPGYPFLAYYPSNRSFTVAEANNLGSITKIDIVRDSIVWIANTEGRLFVSHDFGSTWSASPIPSQGLSDFDMVTESIGYACVGSGIYITEDAGLSWAKTPYESDYGYEILQLCFFTSEIGMLTQQLGSVKVTQDGGRTWKQISEGGEDPDLRDCIFFKKNSQSAFAVNASQPNSIYKSTDQGVTWTRSPEQIGRDCPSIHLYTKPENELHLICRFDFFSTDYGQTWQPYVQPHSTSDYLGEITRFVFVDERNGWGHNPDWDSYGTFFTGDGGRSWEKWQSQFGFDYESPCLLSTGTCPQYPHFFVPLDSSTVFSNDSTRGLYRTTNAGFTWQEVLEPCGTRALEIQGGILYLSTDTLLLISADTGDTWDTLSYGGRVCQSLAVADGYIWIGTVDHEFFYIDPAGRSPEPGFTGLIDTLVVLDSNSLALRVDDTLAISHDFGCTWQSTVVPNLSAYIMEPIGPWLFFTDTRTETFRIAWHLPLEQPYIPAPISAKPQKAGERKGVSPESGIVIRSGKSELFLVGGFSNGPLRLKILRLDGRILIHDRIPFLNRTGAISISELSSGAYIGIISNEAKSESFRFTVTK